MQSKTIRFSRFEVDFEQRELREAGVRVPLQHKPFRILELLLRQPGALVSRQELARELWPGLRVSYDRSLNSAVNSLRQALNDSPRECRFIETRSGLGYRFVAPIEEGNGFPHRTPSTARCNLNHDYITGRHFLNKMTDANVQRAMGCFRSALQDEACFALAQTGLADAYCQLALSGTLAPSDVCLAARDFAAAALRSQPTLPGAHVSMSQVRMILDWDWAKAGEDLHRASELGSATPEWHRARARLFAASRRYEDALFEIRQAQGLDPLSPCIGFDCAWLLYLSGQFQEAATQAWRILTVEPHFDPAQMILGLTYAQLRSFDEAVTELENACTCSDRHPAAVASLGYVCALAGLPARAEESLNELQSQSQSRYVPAYWLAALRAGLGKKREALDALRLSFLRREPQLFWVTGDPLLVSLRSEPDFLALRRYLNSH